VSLDNFEVMNLGFLSNFPFALTIILILYFSFIISVSVQKLFIYLIYLSDIRLLKNKNNEINNKLNEIQFNFYEILVKSWK